jgi:hypothetical protein
MTATTSSIYHLYVAEPGGRNPSTEPSYKLCLANTCTNTTCEICQLAEETPEHIIFGCTTANDVWQRLGMQSITSLDAGSIHTVVATGDVPTTELPTFVALVCWQLWKSRNAKIFRNETNSPQQVLLLCKTSAELWRYRLPRARRHIADQWCSILAMARQGQG